MVQEFKIRGNTVNVHYPENRRAALPVVLLNTSGNGGGEVFDKCRECGCDDFILAAVSDIDWNSQLTPWQVSEYSGQAEDYLRTITDAVIPQVNTFLANDLKVSVSCYAIAGYSLAGLFAVYSAYRTDLFTKIASASGSFWFPGFTEFAEKNTISSRVEKIYLSLGDRESKSRNQIFASVEENTRKLEEIYRSCNIKTIYEENKGNHFQDTVLRMVKGIRWILEQEPS